jgi:hypothetical protein
MTIVDEGKQIRSEVAKLRPGQARRYPEELRRRILDWVERARSSGLLETDCSYAIGIRTGLLTSWRDREHWRTAEEEPLALVPIETPPLAAIGVGLALVAPSGHRVEGLAIDQVVVLLRALS